MQEPKIQLNLRVEPSLMKRIKASGIKYARLMQMGVDYAEKRTELEEELLELRSGNEKLQKRVTYMGARLLELENPKGAQK